MSIGGFILGLLIVAMGFLMIRFNQQVARTLGTPQFLVRTFGPGREYIFYILVSFLIIIVGFMIMFGLFGILTDLIFAPFRGLLKQ